MFIKSSRTVAAVLPLRGDFFKSSGNQAAPSAAHYRPSVTSSLGVWRGRLIETREVKRAPEGDGWTGKDGEGGEQMY